MTDERDVLRDWHRLFGLLLTDFFTGLPFTVEVERDLSAQQQFLDVVIVRRGRGATTIRLPDGLEDLVEHNLITFKSHHETLDAWAIKELVGHYVAYRKLVSLSPSTLLPEGRFRLCAVCARFPDNLSRQAPWQERQPGVYHCRWGTDEVRVIVAGRLPREPHNAPLHLFSASPPLIGFGETMYRRRSESTSQVLRLLFGRLSGEGFNMAYTMEDLKRDMVKRHLPILSDKEWNEVLRQRFLTLLALSDEERKEVFRSLSPDERRKMQQDLEQLSADKRPSRKPRRKK